MATDKVTNPSNASVPVLSSHQAVADAAELSFSDTSADDGEKSAIAGRGMTVSQMPAES